MIQSCPQGVAGKTFYWTITLLDIVTGVKGQQIGWKRSKPATFDLDY